MSKLVAVMALILLGCSESVPVKSIESAQEWCQARGGLKSVYSDSRRDGSEYTLAHCNDGTAVTGNVK